MTEVTTPPTTPTTYKVYLTDDEEGSPPIEANDHMHAAAKAVFDLATRRVVKVGEWVELNVFEIGSDADPQRFRVRAGGGPDDKPSTGGA
jgi:hypothetical protein